MKSKLTEVAIGFAVMVLLGLCVGCTPELVPYEDRCPRPNKSWIWEGCPVTIEDSATLVDACYIVGPNYVQDGGDPDIYIAGRNFLAPVCTKEIAKLGFVVDKGESK